MQTDNKPKTVKTVNAPEASKAPVNAGQEQTSIETLEANVKSAKIALSKADVDNDAEYNAALQALQASQAAVKSAQVKQAQDAKQAEIQAHRAEISAKLQAYRNANGEEVASLEEALIDSMTGGAKKVSTTTGGTGSKGAKGAEIRAILLANKALGFTGAKQAAKDAGFARGTVDTMGTIMKNEGIF